MTRVVRLVIGGLVLLSLLSILARAAGLTETVDDAAAEATYARMQNIAAGIRRQRPATITEQDMWGTPLRYASPGPVHKKGWDLWSCGPNRRDESGGGDDILIGED